MRSASRARGAGMVLALQGQGSCPLLSPNLVCIPPPPANVKADGVADTALKMQRHSATALPSREGGTPERASPLEGLGGAADQGGEEGEPRSTAEGERTREPDGSERSEERAIITFKRPTGRRAPFRGQRLTGVFDRLDPSLLKQKD